MKTTLLILLAMAGAAAAQNAALTKNTTTGVLNGPLATSQDHPVTLGRTNPDTWNTMEAYTSIYSSDTNRHGLMVRTENSAGAAIIGVSETGAPAAKFFQSYNFSSPTVWIGRDPNTWPWGDPPLSPTLMVTSPAFDSVTPIALFKRNQTETVFSIGSDGSVKAPHQKYTDANALVTRGYADLNYTMVSEAGEYVSAAQTGSITMTTGAIQPACSLTLDSGEWDVEGQVVWAIASGTVSCYLKQSISTASTHHAMSYATTAATHTISVGQPNVLTTPVVRVVLAQDTTLFLIVQGSFLTSSLGANSGFIRARRVR